MSIFCFNLDLEKAEKCPLKTTSFHSTVKKMRKLYDVYDTRQRMNLILKLEKLLMHDWFFCEDNFVEEATFADRFLMMFEGIFFFTLTAHTNKLIR